MLAAHDRFAIQDMIARYINSCDNFDQDDALTMVNDDGEIKLFVDGSDQPLLDLTGAAAFRDALAPRHAHHESIGVQVRHLMQNLELVRVSDDCAELRCQVLVLYQRQQNSQDPAPRPV